MRGGVKTESQRAHQDFTPYDGQPKAHVVTSSTSRIVSTFISFHLKKSLTLTSVFTLTHTWAISHMARNGCDSLPHTATEVLERPSV